MSNETVKKEYFSVKKTHKGSLNLVDLVKICNSVIISSIAGGGREGGRRGLVIYVLTGYSYEFVDDRRGANEVENGGENGVRVGTLL